MPECDISYGGCEISEERGCCCRRCRRSRRRFLKGTKECRDEELASVLLGASGALRLFGAARCTPSRDRSERPVDHEEGGKKRIRHGYDVRLRICILISHMSHHVLCKRMP